MAALGKPMAIPTTIDGRLERRGQLLAFTVSFVVVGVPYWWLPYAAVSLPNTLLGLPLLALVIAALWLRAARSRSIWRAARVVGAAVPAAVLARVAVETSIDPTSHNLWPLEVMLAAFVGWPAALLGATLGALLKVQLNRRA